MSAGRVNKPPTHLTMSPSRSPSPVSTIPTRLHTPHSHEQISAPRSRTLKKRGEEMSDPPSPELPQIQDECSGPSTPTQPSPGSISPLTSPVRVTDPNPPNHSPEIVVLKARMLYLLRKNTLYTNPYFERVILWSHAPNLHPTPPTTYQLALINQCRERLEALIIDRELTIRALKNIPGLSDQHLWEQINKGLAMLPEHCPDIDDMTGTVVEITQSIRDLKETIWRVESALWRREEEDMMEMEDRGVAIEGEEEGDRDEKQTEDEVRARLGYHDQDDFEFKMPEEFIINEGTVPVHSPVVVHAKHNPVAMSVEFCTTKGDEVDIDIGKPPVKVEKEPISPSIFAALHISGHSPSPDHLINPGNQSQATGPEDIDLPDAPQDRDLLEFQRAIVQQAASLAASFALKHLTSREDEGEVGKDGEEIDKVRVGAAAAEAVCSSTRLGYGAVDENVQNEIVRLVAEGTLNCGSQQCLGGAEDESMEEMQKKADELAASFDSQNVNNNGISAREIRAREVLAALAKLAAEFHGGLVGDRDSAEQLNLNSNHNDTAYLDEGGTQLLNDLSESNFISTDDTLNLSVNQQDSSRENGRTSILAQTHVEKDKAATIPQRALNTSNSAAYDDNNLTKAGMEEGHVDYSTYLSSYLCQGLQVECVTIGPSTSEGTLSAASVSIAENPTMSEVRIQNTPLKFTGELAPAVHSNTDITTESNDQLPEPFKAMFATPNLAGFGHTKAQCSLGQLGFLTALDGAGPSATLHQGKGGGVADGAPQQDDVFQAKATSSAVQLTHCVPAQRQLGGINSDENGNNTVAFPVEAAKCSTLSVGQIDETYQEEPEIQGPTSYDADWVDEEMERDNEERRNAPNWVA